MAAETCRYQLRIGNCNFMLSGQFGLVNIFRVAILLLSLGKKTPDVNELEYSGKLRILLSIAIQQITRQLKEAGETLGIAVLDHIIFSRHGHYSFLEKGEL